MRERKIPLNLNCGLDLIGEVLYGKWKIRLLWFISEGHKRPSELHRKIPGASRRVLTVQLNELEAHDLIRKKVYAVVPPKVEYSLTAFGKTIIPLIGALGKWADENETRLRDLILNNETKLPEANRDGY
ncbi:winged helix-turn-helix transcriptional regulator [Flavihumibacter petaseus]|uniref:Putative HxlR family transcriptional regulator n=1 Tax=Flavihumibacter petaseus NBRC 106054 TaxID=1220578 RepID=A0A0E9MZZ3_9BACT|nr:winged helix-turn-helix transcriptional regulator [Flavihumibacter petaseus]GAO43108.1 putative HxlR family transcriptional regulator [Flavihumibacter petaseus NBRC 106054]